MRTIRRIASPVLLVLVLLSPATGREVPKDPARGIYHALLAGDTQQLYRCICAAYAEAGVEVPHLLGFEEQSAFVFLSRYKPMEEKIVQSRLLEPGEGFRYWRNWSEKLTGGAWDPEDEFANKGQARLAGNYTLAAILMHEVAHAVCDAHGLNRHDQAYRELLADEYAVRLMNRLAVHSGLCSLRTAYREKVAGHLLAAIPDEARIHLPTGVSGPMTIEELRDFCATFELPADTGIPAYVSFQLARQRILLDDQGLDTLAEFHKAELDRLPPRLWYREKIALETIEVGDVPAWVRHEGPPHELWSVPADRVAQAAAASLGRDAFQFTDADLWRMTGPDSAAVYLTRPDVWPDAPGRLLRIRRLPEDQVEAKLVAVGKLTFAYPPSLVASREGAAVFGICSGAAGVTLGFWVADPDRGTFEKGALHGVKIRGTPPDGEIACWSMGWKGSRVRLAGDTLLTSDRGRLIAIRGRKVHSLAGGIRGYRDDGDPAKARFYSPRILAAEEGVLWLRDDLPTGPVYRRLEF